MFKREIDKLYENMLVKYEKEIDLLDKKEKRKCSCCKGCDHCCYQMIIITDFEKELLRYTISSMIKKEQEKLERKVKEQIKIMEEHGLNKETINPNLSTAEQLDAQGRYFSLKLGCVFLNNGICKIYNRRPIACLTYRNYGDANACSKTISVDTAYTFNNVEINLRREIYNKTTIFPQGFNILQYAVLEIIESL